MSRLLKERIQKHLAHPHARVNQLD